MKSALLDVAGVVLIGAWLVGTALAVLAGGAVALAAYVALRLLDATQGVLHRLPGRNKC